MAININNDLIYFIYSYCERMLLIIITESLSYRQYETMAAEALMSYIDTDNIN